MLTTPPAPPAASRAAAITPPSSDVHLAPPTPADQLDPELAELRALTLAGLKAILANPDTPPREFRLTAAVVLRFISAAERHIRRATPVPPVVDRRETAGAKPPPSPTSTPVPPVVDRRETAGARPATRVPTPSNIINITTLRPTPAAALRCTAGTPFSLSPFHPYGPSSPAPRPSHARKSPAPMYHDWGRSRTHQPEHIMPRAIHALLVLPLALTLTACDSIDGGGSSRPPSNDPPQVGNIPRPHGVPSNADNVSTGYGELRYRVPHEGRVWIANTTRSYEITTVDVKRNDEIEIRPDKDRVELNGKTIYSQNLEKKHQHTIFYRESGSNYGPAPYAGIPRNADWVAGGTGSFEWRADRGGTIYLGDDKTKSLILTARVRTGDLVEIDAKRDFVRLNGRDIYSQNLESKHNLSLFIN